MAVYVYKSAAFLIGSTDLTDHVKAATLKRGADAPESTAMGSTTHTVMAGGLFTEALTILFYQDLGTGSVDEKLDAARGVASTIHLKPTGSGPSANNPDFTGSFVLLNYEPCAGTVGDPAMTTSEWAPAGPVERDVSA
jgi:hypothetical protein